ncbi:hypothetical protein CC85DRAFT_288000 [Cutaneotrichosporon oleaginosum]|uniref:Uncharacterized protein n=1 Tax=Cutaneotrichosporon oleaginosum TaxID=879819 RepID=A0A0J0XFR9_9TREE|nr:uncharacterized protein CC85DRAFT_288000 [Cutaneotrichosporon oleaginosum]KLT39912.1 hypothetical protein CC85DRAFT_288000 [Cutaneotrichosporon oleaginosum]TXT08326.1 hypothetical protein COLE_05250 [Cutaneotrichosporon oleaginosum]
MVTLELRQAPSQLGNGNQGGGGRGGERPDGQGGGQQGQQQGQQQGGQQGGNDQQQQQQPGGNNNPGNNQGNQSRPSDKEDKPDNNKDADRGKTDAKPAPTPTGVATQGLPGPAVFLTSFASDFPTGPSSAPLVEGGRGYVVIKDHKLADNMALFAMSLGAFTLFFIFFLKGTAWAERRAERNTVDHMITEETRWAEKPSQPPQTVQSHPPRHGRAGRVPPPRLHAQLHTPTPPRRHPASPGSPSPSLSPSPLGEYPSYPETFAGPARYAPVPIQSPPTQAGAFSPLRNQPAPPRF